MKSMSVFVSAPAYSSIFSYLAGQIVEQNSLIKHKISDRINEINGMNSRFGSTKNICVYCLLSFIRLACQSYLHSIQYKTNLLCWNKHDHRLDCTDHFLVFIFCSSNALMSQSGIVYSLCDRIFCRLFIGYHFDVARPVSKTSRRRHSICYG